ncbi:APC family permease [Streptomyces prunicolor]|uniref:APC family permease n=1 Tax=Streptomyces prunicolor TaxID=67348 RepID=UPI0033E0094E
MSSVSAANEPKTPTASAPQESQLRGNLGTAHLLFTVLAFNAPLAVVVGFLPVVIGYGNGLGAPMAFVAAGAIIALFAAGFTTMARHLPNPGGFYAYITAGLGRVVGLGSSFVALLCYYFMVIGSYAYGGLVLESLVHDTYHGPDIKWWVWVLLLAAIVGMLGYLKLDLSAKILSALLVCEIVVVLVYDACVVFQGGASGLGTSSFTPHNIFSGSVGIALLYGITCFGGFEATTIFRDEVRNPDRTIPRATYLVIGLVTVLYAGGAWVMIQAVGADKVVAATATDPTGSFISSLQTYSGRVTVDLVTVLLNTSIFAALLSAHNITSRYMYNLSADRILHRSLSRVHRRHGSPHRASLTMTALSLLGLAPFVALGTDPSKLYAVLVGIFGYALIVLLLVTGVAVPVYLRRNRVAGANPWNSVIAPALALVGLAVSVVLATQNFNLLISGSQTLANTMFAVVYGTFAAGVVMALVYRRTKPEVYARIGRQ